MRRRSRRNPRLGNTGYEFRQQAARAMLREALRLEGHDPDMADGLIESAFHYGLNMVQQQQHRIVPVRDYPALRLQATLASAQLVASGQMRRNPRRRSRRNPGIYGVAGWIGMRRRWVTKTFSTKEARDAWLADTREWEGIEIDQMWES
jgi:hypothetical protein